VGFPRCGEVTHWVTSTNFIPIYRRGEVTHWVTPTNFIPIYVESQGFGFTLARATAGSAMLSDHGVGQGPLNALVIL
jgi:hypothetical protein